MSQEGYIWAISAYYLQLLFYVTKAFSLVMLAGLDQTACETQHRRVHILEIAICSYL